jgi:hypothetical protein
MSFFEAENAQCVADAGAATDFVATSADNSSIIRLPTSVACSMPLKWRVTAGGP